MSPPAGGTGSRVHYGWVVVGTASAVLFLTYGVQYAFGLFFTALVDEFGWSRGSLSGVFSLYAATYALLGLPAGRLTDWWGPRRVVALGGCLLGSGLALSGFVDSLLPLYATYFLAGMGMSTAYVPCASTVVRWFSTRRGFATGLALGGAGVGTFVCPPVIALLLARAGWRIAYVVVGVGLGVTLGALSLLLVREPAGRGLRPYGGDDPGRAPAEPAQAAWPLGRILRHRSFIALVSVYTATWMPVFLPVVHLVPLARDLGLSPVVGATALSALGAGSLAGRLALGTLSDLIGRRAALGVGLGLQVLAFLGLTVVGGSLGLLAGAAVYGLGYGGVTALMPAIVGDFFGSTHAGSLVGVVFGVAGPTASLGPVLGGVLFDSTGSYGGAFAAAAGLNGLALALLALARPPAEGVPRATPRSDT